MPKAKITTTFGEIEIEFVDEVDLKNKIDALNMEKINEIINSKFAIESKTYEVLEEFKDLYTVDKNGLRLTQYPKDKSDQIRLAIFLGGRPLNQSEIYVATGIRNPKAYAIAKDFEKIGDSIGIKSEGRMRVTEKVIPLLRAGHK